MSDDGPAANRAESALSRGRRIVDNAYQAADTILDASQARAFRLLWLFLPEPSIASQRNFQALVVSRFLSDAGQQALAYGALIAVVRDGGSAFDAALVGIAALLPPALFGLYGGAVADRLPKRIALAGIYNTQALLCFVAPSFLGTDLVPILILIFAVNALGQVSGPSESSVLPMVANDAQLATSAALISLSSTLGTAFGTALLAPVLVRAFGVRIVIYTAGVLLMLAASRVFDFSSEHDEPTGRINRQLFQHRVSIRETIRWITAQPAVATMIFVAVIAGTAGIVLQTLAPRYVQSVLGVDPADAVYVFAPSAAGLGIALIATPWLIKTRGERPTALIGFVLVAASICLLGLVPHLGFIDPFNPVHTLSWFGLVLNERLRTAALLAFPLGFGLSLSAVSVQTYINRRVPHAVQGRTFALQSALKNGVAILPLATLGIAANEFGVANVLIASPFVLLALAVGLIQLSRHYGGHAPRGRLEELSTFWTEPEGVAT